MTTSRAGRRGPFRAPDTDPSLGRAPGEFALQGSRGPQNGGLGRSCALTELGVFVAVMRTGGLRFLRLVRRRRRSTSVGVIPKWRRSLRLCCANPTARAISDMAVGPNPESNPGLSDLRRRTANDMSTDPQHTGTQEPALVAYTSEADSIAGVSRLRGHLPQLHRPMRCMTRTAQMYGS